MAMPDEVPPSPIPFPLDSLPEWLRSMVAAVGGATKTDASIAAMMSIAVVSAAVARKAVIYTDSELTPPLTLWILVAMGTGQGKSPVFGSLVHPLTLVQRALDAPASSSTPPRASTLRRKTNWERLRENPFAEDAPSVTGVEMEVAVRTMREEQERAHPGLGVEFLTDDLTPAALVETAGSQVAAIAWLSPEGGFDAWIGGGARGTNNMRILNKAWDAADIREGRVGDRRVAERPCLAMGVMAHPEVIMPVLRNPAMTARGYSYRFLVLVPEARIGGEKGPFPRIDQRVADRYRRSVWSLLALPSFTDAQRREPHAIRLSTQANQAYWSFFEGVEARIRAGGDLHELHGWVKKLCQSVIRLAGVLHLAEHVPSEGDDAYALPVTQSTMQNAIAIGEYLIPHARVAYGLPERPALPDDHGSPVPPPVTVSLIDAIVSLIDACDGRTWSGTSTALLAALDAHVPVLHRETGWPRSAQALTNRVGELDSELRRRGLVLDRSRSGASRRIVIRRP
jgi:replicative DNA helicase